jgi:hypothetical protein
MLYKTQAGYFLVGAPAFMRGEGALQRSGKVLTLIMRFSAGLGKSRG